MLKIVGFMYCVLKADWRKINAFMSESSASTGRRRYALALDSIYSAYRYEISPEEFFLFGFDSNRTDSYRSKWVGTTAMYRAQSQWVSKSLRPVFSDKQEFSKHFSGIMRTPSKLVRLPQDIVLLGKWIAQLGYADVFIKPAHGQCGTGARRLVLSPTQLDLEELVGLIRNFGVSGEYIVEPTLQNHPVMAKVNESSLNTVRVVTFNKNSKARVLFARARFGCSGSDVDNLAAGGFAVPVDVDTGQVTGAAVRTTHCKNNIYMYHPDSNVVFTDLVIPHWNEVIALAIKAASVLPEAKIIGWDIAVTPDGPELVEGNHNWCKLLWQLPIQEGQMDKLQELMAL